MENIRLNTPGQDLKNVVILEYNRAGEYVKLYEYLDKYGIDGLAGLFDQDTCKMRIQGYDYPFIKIEYLDTVFVVYSDVEYDVERKELETILFLFFSDGFKDHFTKKDSLWREYTEGCIAFKEWGQSAFTIWQYWGELPTSK